MTASPTPRDLQPRAEPPLDWPEPEALGFGQHLGPYLVEAVHDGTQWSALRIVPRDAARLPLATGGLQYALSVFEGLKTYRDSDGNLHLFRVHDHARRLQHSAARLGMPCPDDALFLESCALAARVHAALVPPAGRGSLYLRPTLFADEELLGLKRAAHHRYSVIATPCSDPPLKTLRLWAEPELIRAAPGGLGAVKTGANYAAGLAGLLRAREQGYDDVAWLDAATHTALSEAGTMNLFIEIDDVLCTPPLDGTLLAGITRDSLLQLARDAGLAVDERELSLPELVQAARAGRIGDAFGCGTAARVVRISELGSAHGRLQFRPSDRVSTLALRLKQVQEDAFAPHPEWRTAVAA